MDPLWKAETSQTSINFTFKECLICQRASTKPLRKLTARGFPSFRSALLTRQDDVYHRLSQYIDDEEDFLKNDPKCHKECKSVYTDRNKLEALKGRQEQEAGDSTPQRG